MSGTLHVRRRIRVNTAVRVSGRDGDRFVLLLALSASNALILVGEPVPAIGEALELHVPTETGGELTVLGGIDCAEPVPEGWVLQLRFMFGDPAVRRALDDLLIRMLVGDGGGQRSHPRVAYPMAVNYGERGRRADLIDISFGGLAMFTPEGVAIGSTTRVRIPLPSGHRHLELRGTVVHCRGVDGRFRVGLRFDELTDDARAEVRALLSELLRR